MNTRRVAYVTFALTIFGCAGGTSASGTDASSAVDAVSLHDAALDDRAVGVDANVGVDLPAPGDVSMADTVQADGSGDGGGCTPTAGTMTLTATCDQVQLAILHSGTGVATVALSGRVNIGVGMSPACVTVDSVDVTQGSSLLATLPGATGGIPSDGETYALAQGAATAALDAMCATDANHFDGVGVVIHGHANGGTYISRCGNNTADVGWPPRAVLTCHTGIASPPLPTVASVMSTSFMGMAFVTDEIFATVSQPPRLSTVDPRVHIVPGTSVAFGGMTMAPMDTLGWMGTTSSMVEPDGRSVTSLSLVNSMDVLGAGLCPTGCVSPPCMGMPPPPVFIARVTGQSATGPYATELYVQICTRR